MNHDIWPDPTPEMLASPEFEAIWQRIKSWDINVPEVYGGYCRATGNHVRAILDALKGRRAAKPLGKLCVCPNCGSPDARDLGPSSMGRSYQCPNCGSFAGVY